MKEVVLVVVMFFTSPAGDAVRERHEYSFPDLASCEKARLSIVSDWQGITIGSQPYGMAAWCK